MRDNKIANKLNNAFNIYFLIVFGFFFLEIFFFGFQSMGHKYTYSVDFWGHLAIMLAAALILFGFCFLYSRYIKAVSKVKLSGRFSEDKFTRNVILASTLLILPLLLFVGYQLRCNPITDLETVERYATDFAKNGNFDLITKDYCDGETYMVRYQNNFAFLFIMAFAYRISYLLSGGIPSFLPVIINCVAICSSILLTAFLSREMFGNAKALLTLSLCLLFAPYYTYAAFYYTDTFSMPFLVGALYILFRAFKSESVKKRIILTFLSGLTAGAGYKIKGSLILLVIAACIYIVLKFSVKQIAAMLLALVIGFAGALGAYKLVFKQAVNISEEQSYKTEFPSSHWVMMGLKGFGGFSDSDRRFTESFEGKDKKQEANISEIQSRIYNMGFGGFISHLYVKSVWTWEDGTYYISRQIQDPVSYNNLHEIVYNSGIYHFWFYVYSCGYQMMLMFLMVVTALKAFKEKKLNFTTLLRGLVIGLMLFLLVWETRSRYLFNFTPVFILLATDAFGFRLKLKKCAASKLKE